LNRKHINQTPTALRHKNENCNGSVPGL